MDDDIFATGFVIVESGDSKVLQRMEIHYKDHAVEFEGTA